MLARGNGLMLCFVLLQSLTEDNHWERYQWESSGKVSLPQCNSSSAIFVLVATYHYISQCGENTNLCQVIFKVGIFA